MKREYVDVSMKLENIRFSRFFTGILFIVGVNLIGGFLISFFIGGFNEGIELVYLLSPIVFAVLAISVLINFLVEDKPLIYLDEGIGRIRI